MLTQQGAQSLLQSQRNWLRFIGTVCPFKASSGIGDATDCLKKEYEQRLKQLAMVGQKIGPFVFNRVDLFAAQPSGDGEYGSRSGFAYRQVGFPQIDNSNAPVIRAWNEKSVKKLASDTDCDGDGDNDADYTVGYANEKVISIAWSDFTYCHGTPHGYGGTTVENLVLRPTPHSLEAAELFGQNETWVPALQAFFWKALQKQGWEPPSEGAKEEILGAAVDPSRWLLTAGGLEVRFNSYEGGCYACTPQPIVVSWADLKSILARNSVAP